jgi:hypothetical protein
MPTDGDVRAMSHPDIVQSALGDEGVAARVDLGDDALFVTPTRTVLYRADKLLSDESVEEFPHGAERITVSAGRRKASLTLDYGLDGERSFTVPAKALDRVLHPVLAGTLNAAGVTVPGETIKETFRFSELTLVVTSHRLVKHVGNAVWDEEYEEFHYDDVTDVAFEEGSVATSLVVTVDGRQERFKAPNESARELRERLTEAVLAHHGVDSVAELRERFAVEEEEESASTMSFGEGPTPLSVSSDDDHDHDGDADADEGATGEADPASAGSGSGGADGADGASEPPVVGAAGEAATASGSGSTEAGASAGGTDLAAPSSQSDRAETVETTDMTETTPDDAAAGVDGDRDTDADDTGVVGTGALLGPPSEDDGTPAGAAVDADDVDADADADVASLAAEVAALRETVESQNERLARQEELIERLIVELRGRL